MSLALRFLGFLLLLGSMPLDGHGQLTLPAVGGPSYDSVWTGHWSGSILRDGRRWALLTVDVVTLRNGTTDASYSLPDRRIMHRPFTRIARDGAGLTVRDEEDSIDVALRLDAATGRLTGTWTQRGVVMDVRLRRSDANDRPQEPSGVIPYATLPMRIPNRAASVTLAGELVTPDASQRHPLALIISDVGEQDRDGTREDGHRPHLVLADHLARHGWASFRWDDRGVGQSTGTMLVANTAELVQDIHAILDRLASEPTVDTSRLALIAMGEGGLVAAAVAAECRADAVILMGMPVMDGPTILRDAFDAEEAELGTPDSVRRVYAAMLTQWMTALRLAPDQRFAAQRIEQIADSFFVATRRDLDTYPALRRVVGRDRHAYVLSAILPWLQRYEALNPAAALRPLASKVHAFLGGNGTTIPAVKNAEAFEVLTGRKAVVVEGANAVLQPCERCTRDEQAEMHQTLAPAVLDGVLRVLGSAR